MNLFLQADAVSGLMGGESFQFIFMMVLIFGVMYFFMIRPQQKRQKELNKFRDSLSNGMKVITAGGIYGTIKEVKEAYVLIEISNSVNIRIDKSMIMKDNTDLANQAK